jgi:hypothetical protein
MKRVSRRMFLCGAGGAMVGIPMLSSLVGSKAFAGSPPPVRYVQWISNHGAYPERFWPFRGDTSRLATRADGVRSIALRDIPGPLSDALGTLFDPYRDKMNVLGGIDVIFSRQLHNASAATCASTNHGTESDPCDSHECFDFKHSVDAILEDNASVLYGAEVRTPVLRLSPGVVSSTKWGSFCWRNGERLYCHDTTLGAARAVFGDAMGGGTVSPGDTVARRTQITNAVIEDYRQVMSGPAISGADKERLGNYMDLLADIQNRMAIPAPECDAPALAPESGPDYTALHENAVDIATAALACGATRVVAYHAFHPSSTAEDTVTQHDWAHNGAFADQHTEMMRYRFSHLARLAGNLDAFTDTDGSKVLDNTILYGANELSDPGHGAGHMLRMPIVTIGGGGGRLRTGEYIDFGGRLMNNLLVTFFDAMGLGPEHYERNGQEGFGDYAGSSAADYSEQFANAALRRSPLPYLYTG